MLLVLDNVTSKKCYLIVDSIIHVNTAGTAYVILPRRQGMHYEI